MLWRKRTLLLVGIISKHSHSQTVHRLACFAQASPQFVCDSADHLWSSSASHSIQNPRAFADMADYWKSNAKHYCEYCNSWLQGDKIVRCMKIHRLTVRALPSMNSWRGTRSMSKSFSGERSVPRSMLSTTKENFRGSWQRLKR